MAKSTRLALLYYIKQRCYAAGALNAVDEKLKSSGAALRAAQAAHRKLRKEKKAITERLGELDVEIAKRSAIDPNDIYARQAIPKRFTPRYGSIAAELVTLLSKADGPLTTVQIVAHMAEKFSLPLGTVEERRYARKWVTQKLNVLVRKGAVVPLHDSFDNKTGIWRWQGI